MNKETSNKTIGQCVLKVLNDERSIRVGEDTGRFVKLMVEAQKLSSGIHEAISNLYGEYQADALFEEDFSKHTTCLFQGLEKYIGISVWESITLKKNLTDTQITI